MIANKIFMVRPAHFKFNPETAASNVFQEPVEEDLEQVQQAALVEFDALVSLLRTHLVDVDVIKDDVNEQRPDAIFPNNWFSTHPGHTLVTFPMLSPKRRRERDPAHIDHIVRNYQVFSHIALDHFESENMFLEGTGSLIIDHEYGMAYANQSPRTNPIPFYRFCELMRFTPVLFNAEDTRGKPIYHTNVVMGIGRGYILINRSAVAPYDWPRLEFYFNQSRKSIIEIDGDQMNQFLANAAFLHNRDHEPFIVMSDTAFRSMHPDQKSKLSEFGTILHSDIRTIEKIGGGSVKCMIAENYLEYREF